MINKNYIYKLLSQHKVRDLVSELESELIQGHLTVSILQEFITFAFEINELDALKAMLQFAKDHNLDVMKGCESTFYQIMLSEVMRRSNLKISPTKSNEGALKGALTLIDCLCIADKLVPIMTEFKHELLKVVFKSGYFLKTCSAKVLQHFYGSDELGILQTFIKLGLVEAFESYFYRSHVSFREKIALLKVAKVKGIQTFKMDVLLGLFQSKDDDKAIAPELVNTIGQYL